MLRNINKLIYIIILLWLLQLTGRIAQAQSVKQDQVIFQQPGLYASHPSLTKGENDQFWVNFGTNTVRSHYGTAAGGTYKSQWIYSPDKGETWFAEGKDRAFKLPPEECGALRLNDGTYLTLNFPANETVDAKKADELAKQGVLIKKWNNNLFSVSYRAFLNIKFKGGKWESRQIDLPSVALIQSHIRGIVLKGDIILIPAYGKQQPTDPAMRAMVLCSEDRGNNWELITIAYDCFHNFSEADLIQISDGTIIAMIRCDNNKEGSEGQGGEGFLWQTTSRDNGITWSAPHKTPIWGYPPNLLLLKDGRLLCTYGYRKYPYGIRACVSQDQGKTWKIDREIVLRDDALSKGEKASQGDLGYPSTVQLQDGTLFTVYYMDLGDGVTHIAATHWSIE